MAYEDNVLIRLRREYSKDEVMMYALNQIKELKIENGKLHAYIDELKDSVPLTTPIKVYPTIEKKLSNDGEVWFKKYSKSQKYVEALLEQLKLSFPLSQKKSMERKLEKQFIHAKGEELERKFVMDKIREKLKESEISEFYEELTVFRETVRLKIYDSPVLKSMMKNNKSELTKT